MLIAGPASTYAQQPAPAQPGTVQVLGPQKSYVYQYILVALCVALGIVIIAQPSKRRESIEKADSLAYGE